MTGIRPVKLLRLRHLPAATGRRLRILSATQHNPASAGHHRLSVGEPGHLAVLILDHLAVLGCHSMPDMTARMDRTTWLLFGIVVILVILAILALFTGRFPL